METFEYDRTKFGGPPRAVDGNDIREYFGNWTNVEVLTRTQQTTGSLSLRPNIGEVNMVLYFITPK